MMRENVPEKRKAYSGRKPLTVATEMNEILAREHVPHQIELIIYE